MVVAAEGPGLGADTIGSTQQVVRHGDAKAVWSAREATWTFDAAGTRRVTKM
jgi:hypothetical protein